MMGNFAQYIGIFMVACLVLEQIICLINVSYLWRVGITIRSRIENISIETIKSRSLDKNIPKKLSVYEKGHEFFFKNKYPYHTLWLGPCVCVARITGVGSSSIRIDVKMCPILFLFFAIAVLRAFIVVIDFSTVAASFGVFLNLFVWFCLMYMYYKILTARLAMLCLR